MVFKSDLSGAEFPSQERVIAKEIQGSLLDFIRREQPAFGEGSCLALSELNAIRERYVADFLERETRELNELQATVLGALKRDSLLTNELEQEDAGDLSMGQRLADKVATFGGSWTFILSFGGFLLVWIVVNAVVLATRAFDPYPFILLNLILSCLAAIQAPIIMMSQNRQEEKDRDRARKDFMINLKSELEIRLLHEKLDHLILRQQRQLIEVQKMQVDMMNEIMNELKQR